MVLMSQLEKSLQWMIESNKLIDGNQLEATKSNRVSLSLFTLCLEHQTAIHLLVDNSVYGSAFAMIRPQFEAFVRGIWFEYCATEEQVDAFIAGEQPPKIRAQIKAIKVHDESQGDSLSAVIDKLWGSFNDYTHGGITQVKARNAEKLIAKNYNPEHIDGLLSYSAVIACSSGIEIAKVINDEELANNITKLHQSIYA
jgi:hypothetical protein